MFEKQMFTMNQIKSAIEHMVALASKRLCAGYWVGFSTANNPEQDPIKMASFYKESRTH
jgi:hypothetical protein